MEQQQAGSLPGSSALRSRGYSAWREPIVRILREKPLGAIGATILLFLAFVGVFADVLMPYAYETMQPVGRLAPPSGTHLMGTDFLGRDVLSRVIYGARVSMYVGLGAVAISVTLGTIFGMLSAWIGGKVDLFFQRLVDAVMSVPSLVLLITIVSIIGPGLVNVILALGLRGSISESRIIRSAVFGIKENQYVEAGRAVGCTEFRLLRVYVLPNIFAPIIVMVTVALGQAILAEASLSFLGLGVQPPTPSWGQMLSGEARQVMIRAPWMAVYPGLAISAAVFAINMLGDALRDVLDPRLRGSGGRVR